MGFRRDVFVILYINDRYKTLSSLLMYFHPPPTLANFNYNLDVIINFKQIRNECILDFSNNNNNNV